VTKGSGYWHFENREALLRAALEEWETKTTERVIGKLECIDDPRERLVSLLRQAFTATLDARVYLALTAADQDPLVAATLRRVSRRRIEFVTRCYEQMACEPGPALHRALAAYAAYLGVVMLSRHSGALAARKDRDAFIEHLLETLL
jgi:AcrR family transcriptional regulator